MPEMGVEGEAEVIAIEPSPAIEEGEGRVVTGTFRHTSGEVYDLTVDGEPEPIGVTRTHPFWSVDRKEWVSAAELRIGESLRAIECRATVTSVKVLPQSEPVYNIEMDGDHCYRVGQQGLLVHNTSAIPKGDGPCERKYALKPVQMKDLPNFSG